MTYSKRKLKTLTVLLPFIISFIFYFNILNQASGKEPWEDVGLQWYYDNLSDEDRKKIRQAFDYCIPRQQVIDGLMKGYAIPLATEIGTNIMGYDPTIQPRSYSTSNALDLLTEVFGKRYDVNEDPSEVYTNVPYFKMTLVSPTTNVARTQWASMIAFALTNVGIDIELKWWNWNIIMPRLFLDPAEPTGANYEHGGFDAYFYGPKMSADPDLSSYYYNESFAPAGDNTIYIERAEIQEIIRESLENPIEADRIQALKEYQAWFYEWVPKSIIRQSLDIFPHDPAMQDLDTYNYGRQPWVHNLTLPTTTMTSLVPGDFIDFNPLMSNSWYDSVPMSNCFLSLAARCGINDLSPYPLLANSWSSTPDGLNWTITLKEGILFEDGAEVTADDVVETYRTAMNSSTSTYAGDMATWFASDQDIYAEGKYIVHLNLQIFYPYVTSQVFGLPIMKADQLRAIDIDNLKTDATNTGAVGLICNGPYKVSSYTTNTITLVANDQYNGVALGHNPANGIFLDSTGDIDTYICTVVKEVTAAVTSLSTGACDLMDPNQGIFGQIEEMEAHPEWAKIIVAPEYGWQELAYNHYDPRWGLNPHDPAEMYPGETTSEETTSSTTETSAETTTEIPVETTTETPAESETSEEIITFLSTKKTETTQETTEIDLLTTPGFEVSCILILSFVYGINTVFSNKKKK